MASRWEDWVDCWFHPENRLGLPRMAAVDQVPYIALILVVEACLGAFVSKRPYYNLRQTIGNVSGGLLAMVLLGTFLRGLNVLPYHLVHTHYRFLELTDANWWFIHLVALLWCDLCHYVQHRIMHQSNTLYAFHIVHHSSPDYNLSVAFRSAAFENTLGWPLYLPLALICPAHVFAWHRTANLIYQTFTHTDLIDKMWWPLEFLLVTPSHHRVHHARNYGSWNHGAMLIIWDRMFGTFQEERPSRPCLYGLNSQPVPLGTYNHLWHQVHHMVATVRLAASGKVPLWKALFTRTTGPSMANPLGQKEYDNRVAAGGQGSEPDAASAAATGTATVKVQASATAKAVAPKATGTHDKGAPNFKDEYVWERRPLGAVDYYAAFHYLFVLVPGSAMFLTETPDVSVKWILLGGAFAVWTLNTLAWLFGAQARVVKQELFRLVVQAALAYHLMSSAPEWAQLAQGMVWLSAASFAFLLAQLAAGNTVPGVGEDCGKKRA